MAKRLTIEFVREQFEKDGYTLLTENYINNKQKLRCICPKGHNYSITWNDWSQGYRCSTCGGTKKLTIEFVRKEFEKESFILLTQEYIDVHHKLEYICPKGHRGAIGWHGWQQGSRCAECAGKKKLTIEFIRNEFKKEGYTLLTTTYENNVQKLEYICSKDHVGTISWVSWQHGCKCLKCSGSKKLTIEFIKEQFNLEGYILLTKKYVNSKQKLEYICPKGHKGNIIWGSWQRNARCKKCAIKNSKGKNSPNWNPNLTKEDRERRDYIPENKKWAREVKKRDSFICQVCKASSGAALIAHHLESYNSNKELRLELSNGITLCESCHKKFHQQRGYGNNTREQFEEFVAQISQKLKKIKRE